ncbi:hypothetical protein [Paenibacillus sp. J22TS3]|uniref:hypothetical protein n=1 Tax=Paenibacillus sp. J22TS3 TaxID=2807192 RepID=UPI001B2F3660|nr:hypothetical protein [Paenibacillus sp. J22TS3]GIP21011.1 hypothetical protein J22TS3_12860 [Paenibacillus sp. J22TS3]
MTLSIVDFGRSIPNSYTFSTNIPLVATPSANTLANFGILAYTGGLVELHASIGLQATAGSPFVLLSIIRDATEIATTQTAIFTSTALETLSFTFVDTNAVSGYHSYILQASVSNNYAVNRANVIGPIVFTGTSLV